MLIPFKSFLLTSFFLLSAFFGFSQDSEIPLSIDSTVFTNSVRFSLTVKQSDLVQFGLYNRLGAAVAELKEKQFEESEEVAFILDSMPASLYISNIQVNQRKKSNKLIFQGNDKNVSTLILDIRVIKRNRNQLSIFPNPAVYDDLSLNIESASSRVEVLIYSSEGKLMYQKQYENPFGIIRANLNTISWLSGQYIVKLKTESGETEEIFIKLSE